MIQINLTSWIAAALQSPIFKLNIVSLSEA